MTMDEQPRSRFVTKQAISSCPAPRAFLYATIVPPITIDQRKPTVDLPQINGPLCLLVGNPRDVTRVPLSPARLLLLRTPYDVRDYVTNDRATVTDDRLFWKKNLLFLSSS